MKNNYLLISIFVFIGIFCTIYSCKYPRLSSISSSSICYFEADSLHEYPLYLIDERKKIYMAIDSVKYKEDMVVFNAYFIVDNKIIKGDSKNSNNFIIYGCPIIIDESFSFFHFGKKMKTYFYDSKKINYLLNTGKKIKVSAFDILTISVFEGTKGYIWEISGGDNVFDLSIIYNNLGDELCSQFIQTREYYEKDCWHNSLEMYGIADSLFNANNPAIEIFIHRKFFTIANC